MIRSLALCLSAALVLAGPAAAQQPPRKPEAPKAEEKPPAPKPQTLEQLFERLKAAKDEDEAKGIASLIERRWARSNSDTANLLMTRANEALFGKDKDFPLAIEILDRLAVLEPAWVEVFNKRATAFYQLGDYERSLLDVRQALAIEPRHYGALSGLGHIMSEYGRNKQAMEAYKKALELHPFLEQLRKQVEKLTPEVEGRAI